MAENDAVAELLAKFTLDPSNWKAQIDQIRADLASVAAQNTQQQQSAKTAEQENLNLLKQEAALNQAIASEAKARASVAQQATAESKAQQAATEAQAAAQKAATESAIQGEAAKRASSEATLASVRAQQA